jgi:hypothetical protein
LLICIWTDFPTAPLLHQKGIQQGLQTKKKALG